MRFERQDFSDWFNSRRLPERLPYLLILGLVAGAGFLALLLGGFPQHEPAVGSPVAPPGGVMVTPAPVPLPVEGEMTVIEPVQTAVPAMARAPTEAMLRQYEKDIFHEVNHRRVENGLPALVWSDAIADVARAHSEDEAHRGYYAHQDPEGRGPAQRFGRLDVAENGMLIEYYTPPLRVDDTVNSWWNSQGHRASMLSAWSQRTGVGVAIKGNAVFITQNFLP